MQRQRRVALVVGVVVVGLHLAAFGALWTNAAGSDPTAPRAVGPDANATELLRAAAANDAARPTTSEIHMVRGDGDRDVRLRVQSDPERARVRATVLEGSAEGLLRGEDVYITGWGRWTHEDGSWSFAARESAYRPRNGRLVFPAPHRARSVEKTVHDDGSVTIRLEDANPAFGVLSFAGENATVTYRIAYHERVPSVAAATAEPAADDGFAVSLERRPGATVERPDSLPPATVEEVLARLETGTWYP